jgi:hypothetical protein
LHWTVTAGDVIILFFSGVLDTYRVFNRPREREKKKRGDIKRREERIEKN